MQPASCTDVLCFPSVLSGWPPRLTGNTVPLVPLSPLVFQQNVPPQRHILPLSFHKSLCSSCYRDSTFLLKILPKFLWFLGYSASPKAPQFGAGVTHSYIASSAQASLLSTSQDSDQVCLFILWCCPQGFLLRPAQALEKEHITHKDALSSYAIILPSGARLVLDSHCTQGPEESFTRWNMPNKWLKQDSYHSTHGTPPILVLIPSNPCLLQPTDIFTQVTKSPQCMLHHLVLGFWFWVFLGGRGVCFCFLFICFWDYITVAGKWSFTSPSAFPT